MADNARKHVLAIDQGTTSSRCIIFDEAAKPIAMHQLEFELVYPQPGWVEIDPEDIWSTQFDSMAVALERSGLSAADIACAGITNQRETTIVWDKETGEPVYNAIVWQCRRTTDYIEALDEDTCKMIHSKTGLIPDPYFSATKIAWILDNVEGARERAERGELLFGTVDSWLIWRLTCGKVHATDRTNASRTMLYNIRTLEWDSELLELFNVPACMLPEVHPSACDYGAIDASLFGGEIEIMAAVGDQQSALFGQCCFDAGQAKVTYGTGCFMLMNTGTFAVMSRNGLLTTLAATVGDEVQYALEGSVFVAGALVGWLCDNLGILDTPAESSSIAYEIGTTDGVYIVPAFTGLGTPYWDPNARGAIYGLTRGTTSKHLIRAALESLAFQGYDILRTMREEAGTMLKGIRVDGGVSKNDFLLQFQADILEVAVLRPSITELTALGAAFLSGLQAGVWSGRDELESLVDIDRVFEPEIDPDKLQRRLAGWKDAVERTMSHQ